MSWIFSLYTSSALSIACINTGKALGGVASVVGRWLSRCVQADADDWAAHCIPALVARPRDHGIAQDAADL